MNAATLEPDRGAHVSLLRLVLRVATVLWACLWTWFVILDGLHDAATLGSTTYPALLGLLAVLWVPTALVWRRPALGAASLVAVGMFALWFFHDAVARCAFAGPPLVLGIALAWSAWRERSHGREEAA